MAKQVTLEELVALHIDDLEESGLSSVKTRASNLRRFLKLHGDRAATDTGEILGEIDAELESMKAGSPGLPGSSYRAIRTAVLAFARWAYRERFVRIPPDLHERLAMPPVCLFGDQRRYPAAVTAYRALLGEMALCKVTSNELDEPYLEAFLCSLPERVSNWRACWREFRACWLSCVEDELVPDLDIPPPPGKKPGAYKIPMEELPTQLRQQLERVRAKLLGSELGDRLVRPMDESTVDLQTGTVLRLLGYLKREKGYDLTSFSLSDALMLQNAKALIAFTNQRWRDRSGATREGQDPGIGAYEYGQLLQLAAVVRYGLRDSALAAEYAEECRFAKKSVQERREAMKEIGCVNDYLGVACDLIERSRAVPTHHQMTRAILVRDALIFGLQSVFADRLSVLAALAIGEHIREGKDGTVLVCIPKEQTKPGIRDLVRELPAELHGLWRQYLDRSRPALLGRRRDHGHLWVAQGGGPLTSGAIYAAFERRCVEQLGVRHNPHQTRKALATDYHHWMPGDSLTLSAVIDSSPHTHERYYIHVEQRGMIRMFDEATRDPWELPREEVAG